MLRADGQALSWPPKWQSLTAVIQNFEKSAAKHSIGKPTLLYFEDSSTIFYPRLYFFVFKSCYDKFGP